MKAPCPKCGGDTYLCQSCGKVCCQCSSPSTWVEGVGNVCAACFAQSSTPACMPHKIEDEDEGHQTYNGFSIAALIQAFNAVQDPNDWKAPIDAWITAAEFRLISTAIDFFTATIPEIVEVDAKHGLHIKAIGYRDGPAGP